MGRKEGGREQHVMEGSQSRAMETVDSGRRFQWEKWISHVAGPVPFLALELQGSGSRSRFRRNWWAEKSCPIGTRCMVTWRGCQVFCCTSKTLGPCSQLWSRAQELREEPHRRPHQLQFLVRAAQSVFTDEKESVSCGSSRRGLHSHPGVEVNRQPPAVCSTAPSDEIHVSFWLEFFVIENHPVPALIHSSETDSSFSQFPRSCRHLLYIVTFPYFLFRLSAGQ